MIYNVMDYGAKGDGQLNDTPSLQRAIDACSQGGGGQVLVPAGSYLTAGLLLKDNVDLHLQQGATLVSSTDPQDFPAEAALPFVLGAAHAQNVSLTGEGRIDGRARLFNLNDDVPGGVNEAPLPFKPFRPRLVLFEDVENLSVRNVTLWDGAMWTLHLGGCRNVTVEGIQILNNDRGANNDGIDPDSCQNVLIANCRIVTGDDAIVLKTTREMTERYGPCENITITGCILHSRDSALKIGTETWGDIRNVQITSCTCYDCSRILGIWMCDGGTISGVYASDLLGSCRSYASNPARYPMHWWGRGEPVYINNSVRRRPAPLDRPEGAPSGVVENIAVRGLSVRCESGIFLKGNNLGPVRNVLLSGIDMTFTRQGTQPTGLFDEQPFTPGIYPHPIPALYACQTEGIQADGLRVRYEKPEGEAWSQLVQMERCKDVTLYRVCGSLAKPELPGMTFTECHSVWVDSARVPNAQTLIECQDSQVQTVRCQDGSSAE